MIISSVSQGLLWGILGLGIYLTFRILKFPDMTTEGSFPLGGAVCVTLMNQGVNPILATILGMLSGMLAGFVTGLLYTKGKIPTILAGILVMTSCHSIMLMVMKRANLGLNEIQTLKDFLPFSNDLNLLVLGLIAILLVISALIYFLYTRLGQAYIATGDNPDMAKSFGIDTDKMEMLGLIVSNGLIALSGALVSQQDGYADVSKGIGVIVIGLASIIIGEVLYSTGLTLFERLIAIVVGSILYQFLITAVIALGFNTNYLKLFSAIVLGICTYGSCPKNEDFERSTLIMVMKIIELKEATVQVSNGLAEMKTILDHVNLSIYEHDFITILGGNGAGKSTLFNVIAGTLMLSGGNIYIMGQDVTNLPAEKRAKYLSRVFQDPKMGTAPRMTVAENLLVAKFRGEKRPLVPRKITNYTEEFQKLIARTGNGLDRHLETPTGLLSGGQRQALSLLMATLKKPNLLLLDEHTAALDPRTSVSLMGLTDEFIKQDSLTALMITHHMEDALKYGNRILVMKDGKIVRDLNQAQKNKMAIADYYQLFD